MPRPPHRIACCLLPLKSQVQNFEQIYDLPAEERDESDEELKPRYDN